MIDKGGDHKGSGKSLRVPVQIMKTVREKQKLDICS